MKKIFEIFLFLLIIDFTAPSQNEKANYRESEILDYTLPDPLIMIVKDKELWLNQRRSDIH